MSNQPVTPNLSNCEHPVAASPVPARIKPERHFARLGLAAAGLLAGIGAVALLLALSAGPAMAQTGSADSLSAGRNHTCYLNALNEFICWGDEAGFPNTGSPDFDPALITDTIQVSAGDYATCALYNDGSIECWSPDSSFVNAVITTTTFSAVSVGTGHACGIDASDEIRCWGDLTSFGGVYSGTVQLISAGDQNDCAIRANGQVECWGADNWNPPNSTFSDLSVGPDHACGILSTGGLTCWGNISLTPPPGLDYIAIESGSDYACAQRSDLRLACWGPNQPAVDTQSTFSAFSAGFLHVCALRPGTGSPTLSCWGTNTQGQAPRISLSPTSIPAYLPLNRAFSQVFTPAGGTPDYTLVMQNSVPGLALNSFTLEGTPTTTGTYNFSLVLAENFAASSLPLALTPLTTAFSTTVQNPATTVSVSANPTQTPVGSPILVSVTVVDQATPTLTGSVTITGVDDTTSAVETTCTVAVASSQASCTLSFSTPGNKTFRAVYNGDTFYLPSPADETSVVIDPVTLVPTLTAGNAFTCDTDQTGQVDCWGKNDSGQSSPPAGLFSVISAGDAHACGRSLNGSLSCWGWNGWGAAEPPQTYDFSSVTSGSLHTCGLRYDGSVVCWGYSLNNRTTPPTGIVFTQISAGDDHTCGLAASGAASCWGLNTSGQATPLAGTFAQLSAGGAFTCALRSDNGALQCWGSAPVTFSSGPYESLEAGRGHVCAIDSVGLLSCWGLNTSGQATVPDPAQTYDAVSAGANHTCALRSDGYLACWGDNSEGQAPVMTLSPTSLPTLDVQVPFLLALTAANARETSYTFSYSGTFPPGLALDANTGQISGTPNQAGVYSFALRAAERNLTPAFSRELNYTQIVRSDTAVAILSVTPSPAMVGQPVIVQVSVSETPGSVMGAFPGQTVTVKANDGIQCSLTLQNGSGSCALFFTAPGSQQIQAIYSGDNLFKPAQTPAATPLTVLPLAVSPQVFSGPSATLVQTADGSLLCPGSPPSAACEALELPGTYRTAAIGGSQVCVLKTDGSIACQPLGTSTPPAAPPIGDFTSISAGGSHACAIDTLGGIACWGDNTAGQSSPLAGTYLAVSAGEAYTCAIRTDGSLACWGNAPVGSLPTGSFGALDSGAGHACALRTTGEAACWGDDTAGQSSPPAGQFTAIAAGDAHSCGLRSTGEIVCWGEDSGGLSSAPYGIFTALSAGDNHTCALRAGPYLTCWGQNDQGEAPAILINPLGSSAILSESLPLSLLAAPASDVTIPALAYWEHGFYPSGGLKPYQAAITKGALPGGLEMRVLLSPAGTILYGTPQIPGIFPFAVAWEDAAGIPLMTERAFTITVTGVDLQVEIEPDHPAIALYQNPFGYTVTVSNQTSLDVQNVSLSVALPEGLSSLSISGLAGCTQAGLSLSCTIASLPAHTSQALTLSGMVTASPGQTLALNATAASSQADWPEIAPDDNQAQSAVLVALANPVFADSFSAPTRNPAWSGGAAITAPSGVRYLGDFTTSSSLHLLLTNLPPHKAVRISFDLFAIGPWNGIDGAPGLWQVGLDGQPPVVSTTFSNLAGSLQNYPANAPGGSFPWRTGAQGVEALGFTGTVDTRYSFTLLLQHSAESLDVLFQSLNLPPGASWGLDNVSLVLEGSNYRINLPLVKNK